MLTSFPFHQVHRSYFLACFVAVFHQNPITLPGHWIEGFKCSNLNILNDFLVLCWLWLLFCTVNLFFKKMIFTT
ncbi:hypothetical protein ABG768_026516, partial [Culter alburnus]